MSSLEPFRNQFRKNVCFALRPRYRRIQHGSYYVGPWAARDWQTSSRPEIGPKVGIIYVLGARALGISRSRCSAVSGTSHECRLPRASVVDRHRSNYSSSSQPCLKVEKKVFTQGSKYMNISSSGARSISLVPTSGHEAQKQDLLSCLKTCSPSSAVRHTNFRDLLWGLR